MSWNPENDRQRERDTEHKHGRLDPPFRSPEPERNERESQPSDDDND